MCECILIQMWEVPIHVNFVLGEAFFFCGTVWRDQKLPAVFFEHCDDRQIFFHRKDLICLPLDLDVADRWNIPVDVINFVVQKHM